MKSHHWLNTLQNSILPHARAPFCNLKKNILIEVKWTRARAWGLYIYYSVTSIFCNIFKWPKLRLKHSGVTMGVCTKILGLRARVGAGSGARAWWRCLSPGGSIDTWAYELKWSTKIQAHGQVFFNPHLLDIFWGDLRKWRRNTATKIHVYAHILT